MQIRILGSAAGGGLPQWNCNCINCRAARSRDSSVRPRTQSSVAVSADGQHWFLLNASPDIRRQLLDCPALAPPGNGQRGSPVAGCILTDAELDHCSGLLFLREGPSFHLHTTPTIRRWLERHFPLAAVLAQFCRPAWIDLPLGEWQDLVPPDGTASRLRFRAFDLGGHAPRFVTSESESMGGTIGLEIEDPRTHGKLVYAPCVAALETPVQEATRGASVILFDGTFWTDDEPVRLGIGARTAREMGHLPVSGVGGSLEWLATLHDAARAYVHINNTNPMLDEQGPEHALARAAGVRVASDGDLFEV